MGFEIVVRPVVFPNIRPGSAQSLPPQDDPDEGFATISGNGAKIISLTDSYSASASTSKKKEKKRQVDVARVYQKEDDGTVNKENFVDIEVANKLWMQGGSQPTPDAGYGTPGAGFGTPGAGSSSTGTTAKELETWLLQRIKEGKNIEITERDKIVFAEREGGGIIR